jgi:hypothetical protein
MLDFCNKLELESLTFVRPNRAFYLYFRCMYGILCFIGTSCFLAEWLKCLTANAEVATFLVSTPASSDTVESEGWQMKQNVG